MIIETYEQRTAEWYAARCGVITASCFKKILAKPRSKNAEPKTRNSYLMELVAERMTGQPTESYQSWAMQRGIELEPYALDAYRKETDLNIREVGFIYLDDDRRIGCSPDGITADATGGVEIKCPGQAAHMKYLNGDDQQREHAAQIQGAMWITGADWWDFVSFCPEFKAAPLVIHRVARDPKMISEISIECYRALEYLDAMYAAVCRTVVSDSTREVSARAIEHMECMGNDGEVDI